LFTMFGGSSMVVPAAGVFGAACAGFLVWNWPPAKIFMGDVGSGYIGFCIATLALAQSRAEPGAFWVFLILGGAFFVDATCTLIRRMLRGEHFYQAHRVHAYQWLARRLGAHRPVVLITLAVNVVWLLPWAWAAIAYPARGLWFAGVALAPLAIGALLAGSGRREKP
jgi:Fuc2NAc and GlcNAc transferase